MKIWIIIAIVTVGVLSTGSYLLYNSGQIENFIISIEPETVQSQGEQTRVLADKGIYKVVTDDKRWNKLSDGNYTVEFTDRNAKKTTISFCHKTITEQKRLPTKEGICRDKECTDTIQLNRKRKDGKVCYERVVDTEEFLKLNPATAYENTTLIDFFGDTFSFNATLYKNVSGEWENSNNIWADVFVDNNTWKHGAEDSFSNGWEHYLYVYQTQNEGGVRFIQEGTQVRVGTSDESYVINPYLGEKIVNVTVNDTDPTSPTYGQMIVVQEAVDTSLCTRAQVTDTLLNVTDPLFEDYGTLYNETLYADCQFTIYDTGNVSTFELSFWNNGSIDPIIEGSSTYDSATSNVTDEGGWTHLETVSSAPYDDLIAYWGFDGDLYTQMVDGQVQGGIDFDGVSDHIDFGSDSSIDNIFNGGGAVCFWIDPDSDGEGSAARILDKRHSTSNGWNLNTQYQSGSNIAVRFIAQFSSGDGAWETPTTIPINTWSHFCMNYNDDATGNNPDMYIDGSLVSETESSTPSGSYQSDASNDLWAGARSALDRDMDGRLDEILFFNETLSSAEILNLYHMGANKTRNNITENLEAEWHLDGTTEDSSANDNHGFASEFAGTAYDYSPNNEDGTYINDAGISYWESYGGTAEFDGTTDSIDIGNGVDVNVPFSVSLWVNRDSSPTTDVLFSNEQITTAYYGFWLQLDASGNVGISYGDGGGTGSTDRRSKIESGTSVSDGNWHHVVAVVSGATNMQIYVDGTDVGGSYSGTGSSLAHGSGSGDLGRWDRTGFPYDLNGQLDEVMLFDDDLTSAEVTAIYNNQSARFKTEGEQTFAAVNETLTGNRVNVTFDSFQSYTDAKINATAGSWQHSYGHKLDDPNLVFYASFNDNATDLVEGKDPQTVGTVNHENLSAFGSSYHFEGSNDYYNYTNIESLFDVTTLSASVWHRTNDTTGAHQIIDAREFDTDGLRVTWASDERYECELELESGGAASFIDSDSLYTDSLWHHIVCIYNGSDLYFYVDNVLQAESAQLSGTFPDDQPGFCIGATCSSGSDLVGHVDEVMIFNDTLTEEEVGRLYATGLSHFSGNAAGLKYTISDPVTVQSDGRANNLSFANGTESFIHLDYFAGNITNPFTTPIIGGDIEYEAYTVDESTGGGGDSCGYTSGTWNMDCADSCHINITYDLSGNTLRLTGTGTVTFNESGRIENVGYFYQQTSCYVKTIPPGGYFIDV